MSAVVLTLVMKDVVIRELGLVMPRPARGTMSMNTLATLVLVVSLLILGLAFTAVDYAIWRRSKNGTVGVNSDAEPVANE